MRETIEGLKRDTSILGERRNINGECSDRWIEVLDRGSLLFENESMDEEYCYKDFSEIDFSGPENSNQEWAQQLNRFYWLAPIARIYEKTKDEKYALIARKTIEVWIDSHPYTEKWPDPNDGLATGDSTLSLSIRVGQLYFGGWWGSIPYLRESPHFDEGFLYRMYGSTMAQLDYLRKNMSKMGNWRISQLDALCFLGLVLPGAEKYLDFALREIRESFHHQIERDGSHIEHTGDYHVWMMEVFTAYALLDKTRPELNLRFDNERVIRMWDYAIHQYASDGRFLGLNDDGRWYERAEPKNVTELRNTRDNLILRLGLDPADYLLGYSGIYPDAGQYYFRKSWASDSPMVVYDATNFGGWHCHTARGSVQFFDGARMLLMDPGSLNYDGGDPFTLAGKQTLMHNTVTINNMVQTPYGDARVDIACDLSNASTAVSTYMGGYWDYDAFFGQWSNVKNMRSAAARHTRAMIWIKDAFVFVIDTLHCMEDNYMYRSAWQMDAGEAKLTEKGAFTTYPIGNVLVQAVECASDLTCRLYKGHDSPLLGYVAKNGARLGGGEPAPMLGIEGICSDVHNAAFAQIIVPFKGENPPDVNSSYKETDGSVYWDININGDNWHIAGDGQLLTGGRLVTQIGEGQSVESDGLLAVVGEKASHVFYAMAVDAGYLAFSGETLFSYDEPGNYEIDINKRFF